MSTSEATTTYETESWRHRRNEVEALRYDGTEHGRRAVVEWVEALGGEASSRVTGDLLVLTLRGWLPVAPGEYVVHGAAVEGRDREFFPLDPATRDACYLTTADRSATLSADQVASQRQAAEDRLAAAVRTSDPDRLHVIVGTLVEQVRTLTASHEAMR